MKEKLKSGWDFDKRHTQIAKGVAILLMLVHHLFAFPMWIVDGEYISAFSINGVEIEYLIGNFAKICVAMFLFLSGYGMYKISERKILTYKSIVNRVMKLLINYWIIFFIFIPIGFLLNRIVKFNFIEFIGNFFVIKSTYNANWWFLSVYIILILLFPIIKFIISKPNMIHSIICIVSIHSVYYMLYIIDNIIPGFIYVQNTTVYKVLTMALAYQINFSIGCIFARYNIFEYIKLMCRKLKIDNKIMYCIVIIIIVMFRYLVINTFIYKVALNNIVTVDAILAPILIYCVVDILICSRLENIFVLFGKNSTNMWLVHGFLCIYYFQYIIYYPKYSILIIVWLVVLSLITSYLINLIYNPIIVIYDTVTLEKIKVNNI